MPLLMSFALQYESVTFAWIDNASVQFPLNIYATKVVSLPSLRPMLSHTLKRGLQRNGKVASRAPL